MRPALKIDIAVPLRLTWGFGGIVLFFVVFHVPRNYKFTIDNECKRIFGDVLRA
jgi:hypothetical protein